MDIQTKDGITLTGIPDGTPEAEIKARIAKIRADLRPKAPGSEPLDLGSMASESAGKVAQGFMRGGPLGAAIAGAGAGMSNMGTLMERGGYKAGEAVTDVLAPHVPAEVAGGAGYLTNVGVQAIPTIAGALLGATTRPGMEAAGRRVMQSALKPAVKDLRTGDAQRAAQTLLDEGVNVTYGGADKLRGLADDLIQQTDDLITPSTATVGKMQPAREVVETIKDFRTQVNPTSDVNAIRNSWTEFNATAPDQMPIQLAQKLKQGTYKALEGKYGELESAATEAQKALARGLRKAIENKVPEVGPINKKIGDLLSALKQVDRRAAVAANRDLMGLSPAGMNPQAAAAMLLDRSQLIKSLLARALYNLGPEAATTTGAATGASLGYSQAEQR